MISIGPEGGGTRRAIVEQIILVIPPDDRPAFRDSPLHHLRRKRPPVDQVTRRDNMIDPELRQIGQYHLQRREIAVNIGDDRDLRHQTTSFPRQYSSRRSPGGALGSKFKVPSSKPLLPNFEL
jgi:hypothetical protein